MSTTMRESNGIAVGERGSVEAATNPDADGGPKKRSSSTLRRLRRRVKLLPLLIGLLGIALSTLVFQRLLAERGEVSTIWVAATDISAEQPLSASSVRTVEVTGSVGFDHFDVDAVPCLLYTSPSPRDS